MNPIKDPMLKKWICANCGKTHKHKEQARICCMTLRELFKIK